MSTTTNTGTNKILDGVIWKGILSFFFPILLGTFFQQLYNTVDAVVVGQFLGQKRREDAVRARIVNIARCREIVM